MVDAYAYAYDFSSLHSNQQHPSFSSTLLDAIYRSIDQGEEYYREPMRKKQTTNYSSNPKFQSQEQMANFQRACMIDKWMEKKAAGQRRSKPPADSQPPKPRENSVSSFFSSLEPESLKPIRTGFDKEKLGKNRGDYSDLNPRGNCGDADLKPKHEGGFLKTKSRALKIYGDLKKVKQPISPGGKLAGFLNSLFTAGNLKKPKHSAAADDSPSLKSANASTCSSASSFSRSCLSKTPSSRGKPSNGANKRSVHFSPVSVIVDDGKNYNKKQIPNSDAAAKNNISGIRTVINEELMLHVMEKNRRVEEVARDLLRNYQRKNQVGCCEFELSFDHLRKPRVEDPDFDDDDLEEEDDDAASCASSDLFELDNLSAIGMERYRQELPVYETTHLGKNRAVANGFIL